MHRYFSEDNYLNKCPARSWRLFSILGALSYSMGMALPAWSQVTTTLSNTGEATYQSPDQQVVNTVTNQVQIDYTVEELAGIRISFDRVQDALTQTVIEAEAPIDSTLSFYFDVTNTSTITNVIRVPAIVSLLNLEVAGSSLYSATNGGNEIVILYDQNGDGVIALSSDQDGDGLWDALAPDGSPRLDQGPEVWIYDETLQDYTNSEGVVWSKGTVFLPRNDVFQIVVTADVAPNLTSGVPLVALVGQPEEGSDTDGDGVIDIDPENLQNLPFVDGTPFEEDRLNRDLYTVNRFSDADTTEDHPIYANGQREATAFQSPPILLESLTAGVTIDSTQITKAGTGLPVSSSTLVAGDLLSYVFTVTNTGSRANPIRIPPTVSLLNLEQVGPSPYTATNGGNEIVILYDQNGNGQIDLTLDQNGNGQWEAIAPDGSPTPDQGPEVWVYNSTIGDYVNSNGVNWSTATVFIPVNGSFQVVVTATVPNNLLGGEPLQVFLGNPPPLTDADGDGVYEVDPTTLQDLAFQAGGLDDLNDRDVYTVNLLAEGGTPDDPNFTNGRREAANFQSITFPNLEAVAGLRVLPTRITDATTGLNLDRDAFANDILSYYFDVTNTSTVPNPIRVPPVVSLFNLEVPGANLYKVTDGGNEIVILYDRDGDGTIALTNDQDGDGQWDPIAPDTSPRADTGPEVWLYDSTLQDYGNSEGLNWSTQTVFVPVQGRFTIVVTADVPSTLAAGSPLQVLVGNPPPLPDLDGDGTPDANPEDLEDLPFLDDGFDRANDQDLYTVNRLEGLTQENYPRFTNGQRETAALAPRLVKVVESQQVDLAIDLTRQGELVPGQLGTYQSTITNNGPGTVNQFIVVPGGFERVIGSPQISLVGAVDGSGNAVDLTNAVVTVLPDGSWLIQGISLTPGTQVTIALTGTVQPLIADVDFQVDVEVRSPLLGDGVTPAFVDTDSTNNFDLQPEQLAVDLGVNLEPVGAIVPGETGSFTVDITHYGSGAITQFLISPTGFDQIFQNGYTLSIGGTTGSFLPLTPDQVQVTRLPDGRWQIDILNGNFFITNQTIQLVVSGIVSNQVASDQFSAQVEIQAPVQADGTPLFVDQDPSNNVDQTSEVLNADLSLDILDPGTLTPGSIGGYTITIANNGPGTIGRFLVTPTGFENVVGNFQLSLLNLRDGAGNLVDLTNGTITVQPNGDWLITGVTLNPGSSLQIQVTGTIQPLVSDVIFQVEGVVSSPLQPDGTPDFLDTNAANNADQEPQQLQVDLAIALQPTTDLIPGQAGSYGITVSNNGPGAVNQFVLSLGGFDTIFTNFTLPVGVYGVNSQGQLLLPDGSVAAVPIRLVGLTNRDGVTPLDLSQIQVTIDDQGFLTIDGFTFIPGQIFQFAVTGTIQTQIADTQFQATVQVQAPLGATGQPLFTDTNSTNDVDNDLKAVDVDLAIQLLVDGNGDNQFGDFTTEQLVSGQPGAYQVRVTNNAGSGSVDRLIIIPTGFNEIFENFTLTPGTYRLDSTGQILNADGTPAGLPIQLVSITGVDLSQVTLSILADGSLQFGGFAFNPGNELILVVRGTVSQFTTDTFSAAFNATVKVQSPCIQTNEDGSCQVFLFQDTNPNNDQDQLIDPLGRVVGCDGNPFSSYQGFTVALYDALDSSCNLGGLTNLLSPNSGQVIQLAPGVVNVNANNENPFDLGQTDSLGSVLQGQYNFLFSQDQATVGRQYVLVITPPTSQSLSQRRILLTVTGRTGTNFSYSATPLDGLPISIDDQTAVAQELSIPQADRNFLVLPATTALVCQNVSLSIQKVADRTTATPGDIVIYRITVQNLSTTTVNNVLVTDRLPLGFILKEDSVQAQIGDAIVGVTTQISNGLAQFRFDRPLPGGDPPSSNPSLTLIYAMEITPDALRGRGRNFALVSGARDDNSLSATNGPSIAEVNLRNGIISDYATLLGRVFVDKNFDGEQQRGEPGVPNAVIYLQNGNRIETDRDGLFSVANLLPGWHVGTLDLSSVPGYTIAPNPHLLERESQSRLVRLEPGGMARMNFAITPIQEEVQP